MIEIDKLEAKRKLKNTWTKMKLRCEKPSDPAYHGYGGRGIFVCKRWRDSFDAFCSDMGPKPTPKHSVDRINNNGPYSPENCRWATHDEQVSNSRTNVFIKYKGQRKTLAQWSRATGITVSCLWWRRKNGFTGDKLFSVKDLKGVYFEFNGRRGTMSELCRIFGVNNKTASLRHKQGFSLEDIFSTNDFRKEKR